MIIHNRYHIENIFLMPCWLDMKVQSIYTIRIRKANGDEIINDDSFVSEGISLASSIVSPAEASEVVTDINLACGLYGPSGTRPSQAITTSSRGDDCLLFNIHEDTFRINWLSTNYYNKNRNNIKCLAIIYVYSRRFLLPVSVSPEAITFHGIYCIRNILWFPSLDTFIDPFIDQGVMLDLSRSNLITTNSLRQMKVHASCPGQEEIQFESNFSQYKFIRRVTSVITQVNTWQILRQWQKEHYSS